MSTALAETAVPADAGQREFSREELKTFDGTDGNPSYIAINGVVYDITGVHIFRDGRHHGVTGGNDVTKLFVHKPAILNRLKVVGTLA